MKLIRWLKKHPIVTYWDPMIIIIAVILFFSLMPKPFTAVGVEKGDLLNFDMLHLLAYFILSFWMGITFKNSKDKILKKNSYILPILIIVIFSGGIELTQSLVPGRYMSFADLIYNIAGTSTAQIIRKILKM